MVYFVGAGPGEKELITVKGMKLLEQADVIIYAGSLVNPALLEYGKPGVQIYNSAGMTLEDVIGVMEETERKGRCTVRLHTGDPSIYGAHREQMDQLDRLGISYEIVPGVSSFLAAAASLKKEYTLPGVSQTVILTRMEGRTPVPETERLEELAVHQSTMLIFLSAGQIGAVAKKLIAGGYAPDTPAAIVYKASWPDEKIVEGTLQDIEEKAKKAGIRKTALIAVGRFLGDVYEQSKLYDKYFSHEFRKGISENQISENQISENQISGDEMSGSEISENEHSGKKISGKKVSGDENSDIVGNLESGR